MRLLVFVMWLLYCFVCFCIIFGIFLLFLYVYLLLRHVVHHLRLFLLGRYTRKYIVPMLARFILRFTCALLDLFLYIGRVFYHVFENKFSASHWLWRNFLTQIRLIELIRLYFIARKARVDFFFTDVSLMATLSELSALSVLRMLNLF